MSSAVLEAPVETVPARAGRFARLRGGLSGLGPWAASAGGAVGVALVAGGLAHHPPAPGRGTVLAAGGVVLFLLAALAGDLALGAPDRPRAGLPRLAVGAVALALGLGALAGGLQHLAGGATVLVPAGLVLSWLGTQVRSAGPLTGALLSAGSGVVVVAAAALHLALPAPAPAPAAPAVPAAVPAPAAPAPVDLQQQLADLEDAVAGLRPAP